jgi:hypothetical protein
MKNPEARRPSDESDSSPPRRLFLHEPGWTIGLKVGSEKAFCYMMNPGQDYYHRILDGEIYLYNDDERLCFGCAERRGLINDQPRGLAMSQPSMDIEIAPDDRGSQFDLVPPSEDGDG